MQARVKKKIVNATKIFYVPDLLLNALTKLYHVFFCTFKRQTKTLDTSYKFILRLLETSLTLSINIIAVRIIK